MRLVQPLHKAASDLSKHFRLFNPKIEIPQSPQVIYSSVEQSSSLQPGDYTNISEDRARIQNVLDKLVKWGLNNQFSGDPRMAVVALPLLLLQGAGTACSASGSQTRHDSEM